MNRHTFNILITGATAAIAGTTATGATPQKPNILYIMCDDMGYGDIGCYGQKLISTPNIDSLANRGIRFTQAYAGSPVSAPSRASLMTGQHTGHTEVRGNKEYWDPRDTVMYGNNIDFAIAGQHPYDPEHIILPEIMKDNGYTTALFGKWAGGYEGSVSTPDKRGIDEFYGYVCQFQAHLYYPNFLNRYSPSRGDTATTRVVMKDNIKHPMYGSGYENRTQYSADMIHAEAMRWLDSVPQDKPFFAVLTYTLPHAELAQPQDSIVQAYKHKFFTDKTWGGQRGSRYNPVVFTHAQFAAMITRLDAYVGELVAKLEQKGIADNTIIVFTSDNGPHEEGGADPTFFGRDGKLKGLKRSCHEGGIRVPFIIAWGDKIKTPAVNDHILAFYDVMPTLCDIIGADITRYRNKSLSVDYFDGISFAPTITGEGKQAKHEFLYWEFGETDQMAVRAGDWKLIVKRGNTELYNLAEDIHEDNDIADAHPEIVDRLVRIALREHTPSDNFSVTLPKVSWN